MRLSQKESDVLAFTHLRADTSIEEIRKATGYRDHTVRYALKRLSDRSIIRKYPFINLSKLGYTLYNIFFSVGAEKRGVVTRLVKHLSKNPNVLWMAEMGGDYQYALEVSAKHISEVRSLLDELSDKFGNIFFKKTVSYQLAVALLPRTYLSSKRVSLKPLRSEITPHAENIDELDERILSVMVTNGDFSHRKLAQLLEVPLSTFELRVKKLREKGVIAGSFFGVDVSQFGFEEFKLLIFSRGMNQSFRDNLLQFAAKHPNMTLLFETFGSWDYEINVEVPMARDVVRITQELYEEFGDDILDIKPLPKFADLKLRLFPLID